MEIESELIEQGWVILFKNKAHELETMQRWAAEREVDLKMGDLLMHVSDHQISYGQRRIMRFNTGVLRQHKKEKKEWVYDGEWARGAIRYLFEDRAST
jgi:hypothetical protein